MFDDSSQPEIQFVTSVVKRKTNPKIFVCEMAPSSHDAVAKNLNEKIIINHDQI